MILNNFSIIWSIDGTLTGATSLGQSGPRSKDNGEVFYNPEISGTNED